jgi:hypothetical protein
MMHTCLLGLYVPHPMPVSLPMLAVPPDKYFRGKIIHKIK